MSKSSSQPSDKSANGSSTGLSPLDSSTGGDSPEPAIYVPPDVANREQQYVTRSKFLVFFTLLVAVSGAATAAFLVMKDEEYGDFEDAFAGLGKEIATVTRQKIDQTFNSLGAYSVFIASEANSTWPFVHLSDFSLKSEKIAALFGFEIPVLAIAPLVREEEKDMWTSFVLETAPVWYKESIDNEGLNLTIEECMDTTVPFVHMSGMVENKLVAVPTTLPGPALPLLQRYPLVTANDGPGSSWSMATSYDFQAITEVADLFKISSSTLRPSIGFTRLPDNRPGYTGKIVVDSQIVQPITDDGELVGMLWLRLPWLEFFQNLYIDGISGTIIVIRNSCEIDEGGDAIRALSYTIEGSDTEFLGEFDAHDPKYDDQVVSKVVVDLKVDSAQIPEGLCVPTLTLDLYPTAELAATFETSKPTLYAIVVVAIFAFTSLVFLLYDYYVSRRQKKFMERIVKQDQIVSNVFPAAIRDRLFARDCVHSMKDITRKLEVALGPDTSALDLRVGIHRLALTASFTHSGQVTAGVLRGERSRFQLFGDTMNTAARMESTSERNRIQVSHVTADLLVASGLSTWVIPRNGMVLVKGKGEMQTYWLNTTAGKAAKQTKSGNEMSTISETLTDFSDCSSVSVAIDNLDLDGVEDMTKRERLVEYNVEVLTSLLQQIIASRDTTEDSEGTSLSDVEATIGTGDTVLEEFVPIIPLKRFDAGDLRRRHEASSIDIGEEAKTQLRNFLSNVATMYRDNPFHNFEHASHVTASVKKLLTRIVNVDDGNGLRVSTDEIDLDDVAGHSYGITSDPLTQFSVLFSAIIHDMDHPGVPNVQLVKENTRSAQIFKKSVAEQNSVELAWGMLMGEEYSAIRACIYNTEEDLRRFRQLIVNTVMATDICDKELQALRRARWETAFADTLLQDETGDDCKATIVIEHLIQASDVSHTMQHWHIYKSWNHKFFNECYGAYKAGRADSDPSESWYRGEIGFFDFYVIPLAKKLDSCGVFGVSSHEYLSYATSNREEWVRKGEKLVQQYVEKYEETNKS
eukprot:scaffold8060_cov110-Cylindrotheca_fusiformis.AAC.4